MKVYELMTILENNPAGMGVRVSDLTREGVGSISIHSIEVDGCDADGTLTLFIESNN